MFGELMPMEEFGNLEPVVSGECAHSRARNSLTLVAEAVGDCPALTPILVPSQSRGRNAVDSESGFVRLSVASPLEESLLAQHSGASGPGGVVRWLRKFLRFGLVTEKEFDTPKAIHHVGALTNELPGRVRVARSHRKRQALLLLSETLLQHQPWLQHHHQWESTGAAARSFAPLLLARATALALLLAGVATALVYPESLHLPRFVVWLLWIATMALFCMMAAVLARLGMVLLRGLRFGRPTLSFGTFPFWMGERLQLTFRMPRGMGSLQNISFLVRCIQEEKVTEGDGKVCDHCYEVFRATLAEVEDPGLEYADAITLSAELPSELQVKGPNSRSRYWELKVTGRASWGVHLKSYFYIPVYPRPEFSQSLDSAMPSSDNVIVVN